MLVERASSHGSGSREGKKGWNMGDYLASFSRLKKVGTRGEYEASLVEC